MWNLANLLTLSRFLTAPLFLALLLQARPESGAGLSGALLGVLVFTLLTDMFDGMVARGQRTVTSFGKIMDPVADSTFFLTALLGLTVSPRFGAPVWALLVVLYREIAMHVLRRYAALRGLVMAAKTSGKAKMVIQSLSLVGLFGWVTLRDAGWAAGSEAQVRNLTWWAMALIALVNLLSLPEYLREIPRLRRRSDADETGAGPAAS